MGRQQQNPEGGWGDDALSAPGTTERVSGPSTVVQTARCVVAAHTTGVLDTPRIDAAVAFLLRHQSKDGGWTDPVEHPASAHPLTDVRTDAYALWAIALHARRTESVRPEEPIFGSDLLGATGPTDRTRAVPPTAVPEEQEGRR
ncbi:prenyltransferase/squalene oxidase repeat-containing protein [Streptomyces sp. NPDC058092]|uniref:prenyltransferase/squalene oxidase repeat-containing protein n=1 Tax=Streptomyces sp. NPDC058092 TaxID=3346336 RepID=UPI0036EF7749